MGLELELDSLAAVVCAAHAFFRGGRGLSRSAKIFLPLAPLSGAVEEAPCLAFG